MLYQRQKILLYFAMLAGAPIERLHLMHLCFWAKYWHVFKSPADGYGFVPGRKGPYSYALDHDLDKLIEKRYLAGVGTTVEIMSTDIYHLLETVPQVGAKLTWELFRQTSEDVRFDSLHRCDTWYTRDVHVYRKWVQPVPTPDLKVYTAGYEGMTFDHFLDRMLRCGIQCVVDVRANPVSRRYGFHRSTLHRALRELGIEYVHEPLLGISAKERSAIGSSNTSDELFDWYVAEVLPRNPEAVNRVASMVAERPSALMCMEADPGQCHRNRLGAAIGCETGLPMVDLKDVPIFNPRVIPPTVVPIPPRTCDMARDG